MSKLSKFIVALPALALVAMPASARCGRHHPCSRTQATRVAAPVVEESASLQPGDTIALPNDATPGECFARVPVPARFETQTEQVVLREASERIEIIPATYETVSEEVLVKPESHEIIDVPPQFKRVEEQVLVAPARTEWQYVACETPAPADRGCNSGHANRATGAKRLCLVEIPAKYETVARMEMIQPPSTRQINRPAEYRTMTRQVVKTPAQEARIAVPAEYGTVTKQVLVADATSEWQQIDCRSGQLQARSQVSGQTTQVSSLQP